MTLYRGQKLHSIYLTMNFIHWMIELALVVDGAFIPSHKVCFTEWIKNLSTNAYEIYKISLDNITLLQNPDSNLLKTVYSPQVMKLIDLFEKQHTLPDDIYKFRNSIVRLSN